MTQRRGVVARRSVGPDVRPRVARRVADPGEAAQPTADRPLQLRRGNGPRHGPGRATRPAEVASREDRSPEDLRDRRRHEGPLDASRLRAAQLHANPNAAARPPVAEPADLAMVARGRNGLRFATAWAGRPAPRRCRARGSAPARRRGPARNPAVSPIACDPAARRQILDSTRRLNPSRARRLGSPAREKVGVSIRVRTHVRVHERGLDPNPARAAARAGGRTRRRACLVDGQSQFLSDHSARRQRWPSRVSSTRTPLSASSARRRSEPAQSRAVLEAARWTRSA